MFIRIKYIKNQPYAYKVRNRWTKKGTRQKTTGYLGRVYYLKPLESHNLLTFEDFLGIPSTVDYIKKSSSRSIILDLIKYELVKHGFKFKGNNRNILLYTKDKVETESESSKKTKVQIRADVAQSILSISNNKKPIVLALNNDFLCNYTLRKLVRFKSFSTGEECGKELAKVFIQAGVPPQPNIFIDVFQKVYSKLGSYVK
jgi:hypothetical protein